MTCCCYLSDCPRDLLETLDSLGRRNKRPGGWSQREWPVSGGQEWSKPEPRHYELLGKTTQALEPRFKILILISMFDLSHWPR